MAHKTSRELIHEMLTGFQEAVGEEPHAYFQPPESVTMSYPCFVYHESAQPVLSANDKPYLAYRVYEVVYITRDPEPDLPEAMKGLKNVHFDRRYTAENLNHFAFTISGMLMWQPSQHALSLIGKDFLGGN